jgi:hypothetical protein
LQYTDFKQKEEEEHEKSELTDRAASSSLIESLRDELDMYENRLVPQLNEDVRLLQETLSEQKKKEKVLEEKVKEYDKDMNCLKEEKTR